MRTKELTAHAFLMQQVDEEEDDWRRLASKVPGFDGEELLIVRRGLAECEAKRRMLALHELVPGLLRGEDPGCRTCVVPGPCESLLLQAAKYADRPEFREEWRV